MGERNEESYGINLLMVIDFGLFLVQKRTKNMNTSKFFFFLFSRVEKDLKKKGT